MSNIQSAFAASDPRQTLAPAVASTVRIAEATFWGKRRQINRTKTLMSQYDQLVKSGCIVALDPGYQGTRYPVLDSDLAKWLEAVATEYSCGTCSEELRLAAIGAMHGFEAIQSRDGYLGSWLFNKPEARYQNLRDEHELYCMGHMLEAFTEYARSGIDDAGRRVAERMIQHLWTEFGPEGRPGYCGHPEIEVALIRWWRFSGDQRALLLAKRQIECRGETPHLFELEARVRKEDHTKHWSWGGADGWNYFQAHAPVREQAAATGHAVRALYLYAGMSELAIAGDESFLPCLRSLWRDAVGKRMYVTGGMGSSKVGEAFGDEYDLPDDTAYCETCAAIALARWALRMLSVDLNAEYGDILELVLHNAFLAGIGLSGDRYFYSNPLAASPHSRRGKEETMSCTRQAWFGCACCPPNIARTLSQIGEFAYGASENTIAIHLYITGSLTFALAGVPMRLEVESGLPWSDEVKISLHPERPVRGTIALRIPGWCRTPAVLVNDKSISIESNTYASISRTWEAGDTVVIKLPMVIERLSAHPAVRAVSGKIALKRGPLVYCLEEADSKAFLDDVSIPFDEPITVEESAECGGCMLLKLTGYRTHPESWEGPLYRAQPRPRIRTLLTAIPYCLWGNRSPGEMRVWIRSVESAEA